MNSYQFTPVGKGIISTNKSIKPDLKFIFCDLWGWQMSKQKTQADCQKFDLQSG